MTPSKSSTQTAKTTAFASAPLADPKAQSSPVVPPLFRRIDWLTFLLTFAAVWLGYYLTLAPEVTLEDSGELATGSFYAGIPHPPGYPVWTIYTWLWTVLVPFKNVAWRVALGEATAGALAAGLLALLVSRGSSLLIEGIEELKAMTGRWERSICAVSGFVAGMLLGYNGFMWSQSVIVEVYSFGVASFMVVLLCLLRWIYSPKQWRYLCLAMFFHGLSFTNHQTLIVAAIGIEVAIAAGDFRVGRELWLGNVIIYLSGLILSSENILTTLESNHAVFVIYHVVGVLSLLAYLWFTFLTRPSIRELGRSVLQACAFLGLAALPSLSSYLGGFLAFVLPLACLAGFLYFGLQTRNQGNEWLLVLILGLCWIAGASFYFYMPLAGMTNPPMEWGYPRTVDGFIHAFTRGQYEKTNPSDVFHHPGVFLTQLGMLGLGIIEEFNWVYAFLALIPFLFFFKLHKRERAWLIGIAAIYLCLGVLLLILLNPPPDRAAQQLVRVFFTASHTLVALLVGYGLTLIAAYMATHYQRFRMLGLLGGAVAIGLALLSFTELTHKTYFGETASLELPKLLAFIAHALFSKNQYGLPVYAGLLLIASAAAYVTALWCYRERAPLALTLGLFFLMPLHSILTHWSDNEQRNHWFGYWFGHDMFSPPFKAADGKPLYPAMAKDSVVFGGTDPGRFCPTYMIFCESLIPHARQPAEDQTFDRRDVYLITQNALADGTYLQYIRAQYNRSTQLDPPFFREFFRLLLHDSEFTTNIVARAAAPLDRFVTSLGDQVEEQRRAGTSWFAEGDFTAAFIARLRPGAQQDALSKYLFNQLKTETQKLVSNQGDTPQLRRRLAQDLNAMMKRELGAPQSPLADSVRLKQVPLSEYLSDFLKQNPQSHTRIRLNRLLLEAAYPAELAKSPGGVYPDREIYTPSPEDLARCLNEYTSDARRRLELHQLRPGENVAFDPSGRIQISGQVAVMAINALLTKVIFDHNPKNDFYVEESYPLDWMFPYLTPFGIIMKINRQPIPELTEDTIRRDHQFWTEYSQRLIGNWITYETPVKDIAAWVEKVYLRRDFNGFTGDRKFVRDDQAQKSFSKLRSSIGGLYAWRVANSAPGTSEHKRAIKEADFAFRQAFAISPYNPDAIGRYVNLLIHPEVQRFDDALILAYTLQKLDPYNGFAIDLVNKLQQWKKERAEFEQKRGQLDPTSLERAVRANPDDFQSAFNLASVYLELGKSDEALKTLDEILNSPHAQANAWRALIQAYTSLNHRAKLQETVDRLAADFSAHPENLEAGLGLAEGYQALRQFELQSQALDKIMSSPNIDANTAAQVAKQYAGLTNFQKLEITLQKLVQLNPLSPEGWYDLGRFKLAVGKTNEASEALRHCLELNRQRLSQDPKARDLATEMRRDQRLAPLQQELERKTRTNGN